MFYSMFGTEYGRECKKISSYCSSENTSNNGLGYCGDVLSYGSIRALLSDWYLGPHSRCPIVESATKLIIYSALSHAVGQPKNRAVLL
jgi:hypothetical protein